MPWNLCGTDAPNLLLQVLALNGCDDQGVFIAVKVVLSKWSAVCNTVTKLHTYQNFMRGLCFNWNFNKCAAV
jgi:hypothetical protein